MKCFSASRFAATVVVLALLLTQLSGIVFVTHAEEDNWGENLVDQADLTLTDYNAQYLDVTLDADSTYELSCDITVNSIGTTNLAVILRENDTEGLYLDFWYSLNQIRLGEVIDGNGWATAEHPEDSLVNGTITFEQGKTYNLRVVMEPKQVVYYIDGELVNVILGGNYGYGTRDYTTVRKITDGKVGFIAQNTDPDVTVSNITLKKQADHIWAEPTAMEDTTLTDYDYHWIDKVMEKDTTYKLDFDLTFNNIDTSRLGVIMRANESDGYYLSIWPDSNLHQMRLGASQDGNGWPSLANGTLVNQKIIFEAGRTYSFSLVMEPEKVFLYVDGSLIQVTLGSEEGYAERDYTTVTRLANAKAGFIAQHQSPNVTVSNVKLYEDAKGPQPPDVDQAKVQQVIDAISAIGEVTAESGPTIEAARALYEGLNEYEAALITNLDVLLAAEKTFKLMGSSQDLILYGLDATYAMGFNYWGQGIRISNAPGGGMRVEYNNGGTGVRQGVNRPFKLDGMHMVVSGLNFTSDIKTIAFYIADLDLQESYSTPNWDNGNLPLCIILDPDEGAIRLGYLPGGFAYADEIIGTNDAWKYENIKDIEWSMRMRASGDGGYVLSVNGAEAVITKEQVDRCTILHDYDNAYLTVCPWDMGSRVCGSFDILSLHDDTQTCAEDLTLDEINGVIDLIDKIAALGEITVESEAAVKALEDEYAAMSDLQKGCIVNYKALSAARYKLNMLGHDTVYECIKYYYITSEDVVGTNHWTSNLFITDVPGGGANLEWYNAGTNVRQLIDRELDLDGMHMVFDNFVAEGSNKKMAIFLAGLYDTAADWTSLYSEWVQGQSTIVALIFDFSFGTLTAHVENNPDVVVLRDDRLTYDFLKGSKWDMKITKRTDGDFDVTVAGVTGVLPKSLIDEATRLYSTESVYATMSGWGIGYNFSVDVLAVHSGSVVCADDLTEEQKDTLQDVIDAINAIYDENWQIVPSAQDKLDVAWDLYDALPGDMKDLVANIKDLEIADTVMLVANQIDRLGEITLDSAEAIADARVAYKELPPAYRPILGNYADLNQAVVKLYQIRKELNLGDAVNEKPGELPAGEPGEQTGYIDNSSLLPPYVDDADVQLEASGLGGELLSPDWVKTLIIAELNVEVATPEGTFDAAIPLLDHYAETGVNGIWLTPVFDDDDLSCYGNFGPHTVSKAKTGCDNYEDGFRNFKHFVDEAHKRNIRVFIDIVTWGCDLEAPLYNEHPEWFKGYDRWGGWSYDFSNEEFYEYFVSHLVWWTTDMGVDGFRCDCEPAYTGYTMFKDVRVRALEAGQKICIFSESTNERMNGCYDFDEHSAGASDDLWGNYDLYTEKYNLMDTVKKGIGLSTPYYQLTDEASRERFYAYLMSCHDTTFYGMEGKMSLAAYEGLMSPFIPIFFMGEEFNNSVKTEGNMYRNRLEISLLDDPEHRAYYEEFKSLIRIRRLHPEIFTEFPNVLREAKIEEVEVVGLETIQGYVRYNDEEAIIVVANNNVHTAGPFTVRVPYLEIGFEDAEYQLTDLLTGKVIAVGNYATLYDFQADIAQDKAGIYMLTKTADIPEDQRHTLMTYEELAELYGVTLGDVDGDGQITSTDARLALQISVGKLTAEDVEHPEAADVDGDGKITSTDARLLLQVAVGKITEEDLPANRH